MTRSVRVAAARLPRWVENFAGRHGGAPAVTVSADRTQVVLSAPDGAVATFDVPFPPLAETSNPGGPLAALAAHVAIPRVVGVVLLRRGGYSVGVAESGTVLASKTGTRYVQGTTAAGGQSQQRFARRREGQAAGLVQATHDVVVRVLLDPVKPLQALAIGGDATLTAELLAMPRLRPLLTLPRLDPPGHLPDPRRAVLDDVAASLTDLTVHLDDPAPT